MNNKKIGIITFHTALNYGAVLQTYALQNFLFDNKIDNEVLNYDCQYIKDCYKPFHIANKKVLSALVRGIMFGKNIKIKRRKFDSFLKEKIVLSKYYKNFYDIKYDKDNYSAFITGSDQVFSPISAGFDEAYFLPFADDCQKYSYAASFGVSKIDTNMAQEYKKRLSGFSSFSLREESGKEIINSLFPNIKTFVHVDPTLLLEKKDWEKLVKDRIVKEDYVLVFNVEKCINDLEFAKKYAKKNDLKIVYINARTIFKESNIKYFEAPGIEEFLNLFYYSKAIVTNSFHGTVFSIIFEKEFFTEVENKKQKNIRIISLLEKLDIKNRDISSNEFTCIEWEKIYDILNIERQNSKKYFENIMAKS